MITSSFVIARLSVPSMSIIYAQRKEQPMTLKNIIKFLIIHVQSMAYGSMTVYYIVMIILAIVRHK